MCHLSTLAIELNLVLFQLAKIMQATYRAFVELIHSYLRKSGIILGFQCDQFLPALSKMYYSIKPNFFSPAEEFRISPRQEPHPRQTITARGVGRCQYQAQEVVLRRRNRGDFAREPSPLRFCTSNAASKFFGTFSLFKIAVWTSLKGSALRVL